MLEEVKRQNIREILINFSHMKHLEDLREWGIKKRRKEDSIDALISYINSNENKYEEFCEWMSLFTMNGYNNYYIFNYDQIYKDRLIGALRESITTEDITELNATNIGYTRLVYKNFEQDEQRFIFRYASPGKILIKQNVDGEIGNVINDTLYFATIFIDINLKQVIVSIPPTTGMLEVDGVEIQGRDFHNVALHYLELVQLLVGGFNVVKCDGWIFSALDKLADEGTAHNNPIVTQKSINAAECINIFVNELLNTSGIVSTASIQYMEEQVSILFENVLVEQYGIVECDDNYEVFCQNGDQINSLVRVESKMSNLKQGRAAAIAKSSRNSSELCLLGITKKFNEGTFKFLIEVDTCNYYTIRTSTSIYVTERVMYDVIRKVGSYKNIT